MNYIAGLGYGCRLGVGFLNSAEIGIRDLSLCNVNMFCIVQCRHWVLNLSPGLYLSPSLAM